ncbi:GAF domain-containing protein [bacterium]|nr:GAF domain-containing protein [bacterium]
MTDNGKGNEQEYIDRIKLYDWLFDLDRNVGSTLKPEVVTEKAVVWADKFCEEITGVVVHTLNSSDGLLYPQSQAGLGPDVASSGLIRKGEGLAGAVAETGAPLFIPIMSNDIHAESELVKKNEFTSYAGIPLVHNNKIMGVLSLYSQIPKAFSDFEQEILLKAGTIIGNAIESSYAYYKASDRARRLVAVSRAITVTRQLGPLENVLKDISKVLVQTLGFDKSWIGIIDNDMQELRGMGGFGRDMQKVNCFYSKIDKKSENPAIQTIVLEKPVICQFIDDITEKSCRKWLTEQNIQSLAFVPILNDEKAVGVVGVFNTSSIMLNDEDIKTLVSVAEQAAIALENSNLYEKIKQSEENYRTLFQAAGSGLAIIDEDQMFKLVNHAFEEVSGYSQKELVKEHALTTFLSGKNFTRKKIKSLLVEPPQDFEADFIDKDGSVKQVHITTTRLPNEDNILISVINVSRQRELERRLFKSEELAAIGELSAGIAHEIRNPLIAIKTSVKLLKDEPQLSEEGHQLLDILKEESDHLAAIVDDFLKFARPKKPAIENNDINQLLKDTVRRCREITKIQVEWQEDYNDKIPPVPCDRHQVQQVITNLINNGLDAMKSGGTLQIKTNFRKRKSNSVAIVSIHDTGKGIPEDEIEKIFQPFFSTKESGTGMGLAICQRIVDAHNGEIIVESKERGGTEFSIILPLDLKG